MLKFFIARKHPIFCSQPSSAFKAWNSHTLHKPEGLEWNIAQKGNRTSIPAINLCHAIIEAES
jgi:hypothetical protein